ncbi:MAG: hypothetical protein K2W82_09415 [Candidatus Obscuribacterales bacterium]|nr:hypothetical protein [Candidatus Obscuribacterales bacterium]
MSPEQLRQFISSKMSISHVYQPAFIIALLENHGQASVDQIARKCADLEGGTPATYGPKLTKYPKEALTKHGVITPVGKTEFKLTTDITQLSQQARQELSDLCKRRMDKVK